MTKINTHTILTKTAEMYSRLGYENFSIRKLAKELNIAHSVIYHYYENEEVLLEEMFNYLSKELGIKRSNLPQIKNADDMLRQRIEFQIDNAQTIVAIFKYYLSHRPKYKKHSGGFVPDKATLHIEEVLEHGTKTGEFKTHNIKDDARVITHAINGFLLEYHPYKPSTEEKKELINIISNFLLRSLKGGDKHE